MPERKFINWESPKIIKRLFDLAREGNTLQEIANNLECGLSTLKNRMTRDKIVKDSIKKGRAISITTILPIAESALIKNLKGYNYSKIKYFYEDSGKKDKKGNKIYNKVPAEEVLTHVKGDTTAQIFYLVNNSEKYQSINNVKNDQDNNKGWIRQFIETEKEKANIEKQKQQNTEE